MFSLITQLHQLPQLLGMGPPVMQDWDDLEEPGTGAGNWYYPVLDSEGSTVCYEYMSIKLQSPEMQQWGCRGEFPGSEFRRVSPTPSGRSVCGSRTWDSSTLQHGCQDTVYWMPSAHPRSM
uniref:Uncharacterized protein n=1 Tax=Hanusia phi TaxID=3032 RepID=A0A7S0E4E0_9CRYP|mmetsp:Transcript_16530/g.37737  ORF Transcript_16530/g.37737 Transcript_16530/m.37737 type:complete len:121 (+) Transcript_16530:26-388(+)